MKDRFLGAVQFLTVLPVGGRAARPGDAAIFFPAAGGLLGVTAAGVLWAFEAHWGRSLGAMLAIGWLMVATGCLHEDGLADVADAFRAGRSREKIMLILKDSRIGTYGGVVLAMSTLLRWQALVQCGVNPMRALPAVLALSRMSLVVLAWAAPPAGEGLGREFARGCSGTVTSFVVLQAAALSFLAGWLPALLMLTATAAIIALARRYFLRRLGGVNGDCLGATCLIVETANLVILACRFSI